jgi:hypothetical protein
MALERQELVKWEVE